MARSEDLISFPGKPVPRGMRVCEYALRFGPARVSGGRFSRLRVVCADRFRPDRLMVSPEIAEKFTVDHLQIFRVERGIVKDSVRLVLGENLAIWLKDASIEPGQLVVLEVTNTSKKDAKFQCCLMGKAVVEIREKGSAPTYLDRKKTPGFSRRK